MLTMLNSLGDQLRSVSQTFPFINTLEKRKICKHDGWRSSETCLTLNIDIAVLVEDQVVQSLCSLEKSLVVLLVVQVNWAMDDVLNSITSQFTKLSLPIDASLIHLVLSQQVKNSSDSFSSEGLHIIWVFNVWSNPYLGVCDLGHLEVRKIVTVALRETSIDNIAISSVILTYVISILSSVSGWIDNSHLSHLGSLSELSATAAKGVAVGEMNVFIDDGLTIVSQSNRSLIWSHWLAIFLVHPGLAGWNSSHHEVFTELWS
jgi:hypothetical protein